LSCFPPNQSPGAVWGLSRPFASAGRRTTQNAFSEWGARSLSLNVAQQTTNSLRTTLGADFAGQVGLGNERKLDLGLRLGWLRLSW